MAAGMREQERIANNLANTNTVAYKRQRSFTESLEEFLDHEGSPQSTRNQIFRASMDPGPLEKTGNPLDVAISGEGFFALTDEVSGNRRYTRAGQFTLDDEGMLRSASGHLVEGHGGPIQFPAGFERVEITPDGSIRADSQVIGRISVFRFDNPQALERLDSSGFDAAGMEAVDATTSTVLQGHLEGGNVNPIAEMSDMITHFRLFESQQKMLQTTDQVLGQATRELGRF